MIVDSIPHKSNLEDIFLLSDVVGHDNETVMAALPNVKHLVCNTPSLGSLYQSNHQMKWLGNNTDAILAWNPTVRKVLEVNS